jgi:predicted Fe-Mo cluster-binding NifX family protein
MKVAVPTRGNVVDDHFGHCEMYTVFTVDENSKIEKAEILPSPQGCGCKSNIAFVLKEMGVSVMLAGNMGNGALSVLNSQGIQVFRGCQGDVRQLVETFL